MVRVGFVFINKGVDEIEGALALHEAEQGMQAAEGVPKRKHRIDRSFRLVNLQIVGTIAAIGIAEEVGGNHAMVKSRIEHRLVRFVGVAHGVAFQFGVPFVEGFLLQGIEIEVVGCQFVVQVVFRAFHIDGGNGNTHHDLLIFLGIEVEPSLDEVAFHALLLGWNALINKGVALEGFREFGIEIEMLFSCPISCAAETADGIVALHLKPRVVNKLIVHAFHHVQKQVRVVALGEGAAHHPDAVASSEFHFGVVIIEQHGIIARLGILVLMFER